jgi:hypothetical protein
MMNSPYYFGPPVLGDPVYKKLRIRYDVKKIALEQTYLLGVRLNFRSKLALKSRL